jgi:hypothetical protein
MGGFSVERARAELNIPERYQPQCMIAIGIPGDPSHLSEFYRAREIPSQRKPLEEIIHEGGFVSKK